MRFNQALLFAGVAFSALSSTAHGQDVAAEGAPAATETTDIIVSARRRDESLQDVPQTVNAVSADTIAKLRINKISDIAQIVPGLSIEGSSSGSGGFGSSSGIRGVPTFLNSNANPVVQFYLNDAPVGADVSQSLFDIGQIEVVKGPQGTLRGRSAPTGAITVTTRRPDLDRVGGYVNLSGTHRSNINAQVALGIPLIRDVLAVRLAASIDHNDGNGVTSANYRADPYAKTEVVRGTVHFEPTPNLQATLMYQRNWRSTRSFSQLAGNGNGTNGPIIAPHDRLGIVDRPNESRSTTDFLVGQAELRFGGQKLNYVGAYRDSRASGRAPQDNANVLPGIEYFQFTETPSKETSHELRLSSDERVAGIFDYVVGAFYDRSTSHPTVNGTARFLSGAFGRPGTLPVVQEPLARYTLRNFIAIDPVATEKSVFANLTAHLGDKTEVAVGGRYIDYKRRDRFSIDLQGGFNAITNPLIPSPAFCGFLPGVPAGTAASPIYTGLPAVCDVPVASSNIQTVDRRSNFSPLLYNVSVSHKFTPDFMLYGNVGSAFRSAGPSIGITSPLVCCTAAGGPDLGSIEDLIFHGEEKSTTYEIGFKSSFFDRRLRLNVSLFKQDFENFFFLTQSTNYLSVTNPSNPFAQNPQGVYTGSTVGASEFTADADAKVKGIDVEVAFQITRRWNLNLGFTWSKAQLANALVPCNDGDFDGVVDTITPTPGDFQRAGTLVARCRSNEAISRTPRWNLTLQSEYAVPVSDRVDGFIRGNFVYYPDNPNSSQGRVIDKYSLLNMFAGIRSPDGDWEVSIFANNLLNTQQVLAVTPLAPNSAGNPGAFFGNPVSNYQTIGYTPRREFGLNVRYMFGSR